MGIFAYNFKRNCEFLSLFASKITENHAKTSKFYQNLITFNKEIFGIYGFNF